jgi:hypothetical protein
MNLVIAASILSFASVMVKGLESKYERAIKKVWGSNSTTAEDRRNLLLSLVRYGTLSPSSHNTQCWKFIIDSEANSIRIKPDLSRRCPMVDPGEWNLLYKQIICTTNHTVAHFLYRLTKDDHHLYATLGCALENVVIVQLKHVA